MADTIRRRWLILFLVAVMAGSSVGAVAGIAAYRAGSARQTISQNQETLCQVLRRIVMEGDASLSQVSYYQSHPDELAAAHQRTQQTLRELDCNNIAP